MDGNGWQRSDLRRGPVRTRKRRFRRCAGSSSSRRASSRRWATARRRPRFHLDRPLQEAPGRDGLREPGARVLARARGGARQADPRRPEGAVARNRRRGRATSATTASIRRPPAIVYLAAADERVSRATRVRSQRRIAFVDPQHPRPAPSGFVNEIRQAVWSVNPEPAAGERAHAAGTLRPVDGAHLVHAGDAGDRRRHGAAARRRRHLRRDLLLRSRSARAKSASASRSARRRRGHAHVRPPRAAARGASASPFGLARRGRADAAHVVAALRRQRRSIRSLTRRWPAASSPRPCWRAQSPRSSGPRSTRWMRCARNNK